MLVTKIQKNSLAQRIGIRSGDQIVAINGHRIRDPLDFKFWAYEEHTHLKVLRDKKIIEIKMEGGLEDFGAEFSPMKYRCCGNKCIFCFIDQNPKGLRKSLYFKDEDFRLSFLYGNYVTLTNVSESDLERIVEQRLSPLYISVHAVDSQIRKELFGLKQDDLLMEKIAFLSSNKIKMHVQIVLCPAINDGKILEQTVTELSQFYPWISTIAIVPVGLTRHRQGLPTVLPVNKEIAKKIIDWAEEQSKHFLLKLHSHFIFLADEFYLLAQLPIPTTERYEDFAQIENGVGMIRNEMNRIQDEKHHFPKRMSRSFHVSLITGTLAQNFITREIVSNLIKIKNLSVQVIPIINTFFGDSITVSGLLVGQDIYNALVKYELGDVVWLPANCINSDGFFLDDWTSEDLFTKLGVNIKIVDQGFAQALLELEKLK